MLVIECSPLNGTDQNAHPTVGEDIILPTQVG